MQIQYFYFVFLMIVHIKKIIITENIKIKAYYSNISIDFN